MNMKQRIARVSNRGERPRERPNKYPRKRPRSGPAHARVARGRLQQRPRARSQRVEPAKHDLGKDLPVVLRTRVRPVTNVAPGVRPLVYSRPRSGRSRRRSPPGYPAGAVRGVRHGYARPQSGPRPSGRGRCVKPVWRSITRLHCRSPASTASTATRTGGVPGRPRTFDGYATNATHAKRARTVRSLARYKGRKRIPRSTRRRTASPRLYVT